MSVFDGSVYRIRARFDDDPAMGVVTVHTDNPRAYFDGLERAGMAPSAARVHLLKYVIVDTDMNFGELEDED
ncbi:hypothetical protein AB0K92_15970 [Streptomyces sp. NPDC052687]|uniref:hypothetical protein n=1 Tax=Streptomyces sp. NPDC052687 TaxID=3154759 RepID=UPI0034417AAF